MLKVFPAFVQQIKIGWIFDVYRSYCGVQNQLPLIPLFSLFLLLFGRIPVFLSLLAPCVCASSILRICFIGWRLQVIVLFVILFVPVYVSDLLGPPSRTDTFVDFGKSVTEKRFRKCTIMLESNRGSSR